MKLIINADDFGLTKTETLATLEAYEKGLITDTTVVANGTFFEEAVRLAQSSTLAENIGIHFNLTEGIPLTEKIKLCRRFTASGHFRGKIDRYTPLRHDEKIAVYEELTAQIKRAEDNGIILTHADSHNFIHTAPCISKIFFRVCKEHGLEKIRTHRNIGKMALWKRCVKFVLNRRNRKAGLVMTDCFGSLEDFHSGVKGETVEIMVHPAYDKAGVLIDWNDWSTDERIGPPLETLPKLNEMNRTSYRNLSINT